MKNSVARTALLFVFIIMVFYCYGAGMMDYFAIYEPWNMIDEKIFPSFHGFQGERVMNIFVIPSGIMTILNILVVLFPPSYASRRLLIYALIAYAFDWIFSFTMQIPIQLKLAEAKDPALIRELLSTNWWRFAADTVQFVIVCTILWKLLRQLESNRRAVS